MNPIRIASIAGLSCAIAGFATAAAAGEGPAEPTQAPAPGAPGLAPVTPPAAAPVTLPAAPPAPDRTAAPRRGWYIGVGIGPGFGPKYKLNGQTITFDQRLQSATDKTSPLALNIANAGIALGPGLLFGFSGSAVAQFGTIAGKDTQLQINNYFAAFTWFPAERGFFVRGGGGPSNMLIDTGTNVDRVSGLGVLVGAGFALDIARGHNITFTVDHSRQSYGGSSTKPESSQFSAAYLGYMYRR
jgi:hypothetical protein